MPDLFGTDVRNGNKKGVRDRLSKDNRGQVQFHSRDLRLNRSCIMNCFSGRFVVCAAVLMVSASALAQDRGCQKISKRCHRSSEIRGCVIHDAAYSSTVATCAPAATCCQPVPTCCWPSATTCCSEIVCSSPADCGGLTTEQIPQPQFPEQWNIPDFNSPEARYWQRLRDRANELKIGR